MSTTRRRATAIALAALGVAAVVLSTAMAAPAVTPGSVTITAYFVDAQPLVPGNQVKAAGVPVGTIDEVSLERGLAKVDMTVDRTVLPLKADGTARIVTQDLLGERFVGLERGSPAAPALAEPFVLQPDRTSRGTDLQEVLNSVDDPTGTALAAMTTTLGEGLGGQGKNAAAAIAALRPAMQQTGELAGVLGSQNDVLRQLVDQARPVAQAVATDDGRKLDRLVDSTSDTLGAVGAREKQVQETLQQLPDTIRSARQTLANLAGVADPTADTLKSIRPVTDDLAGISKELEGFSESANPALATLPEVLDRGRKLFEELGPVVKALQPIGEDLKVIGPDAKKLSDTFVSARLTNLMEFVKGWSMATSDYDAVSHYFKAIVVASPKAAGQASGSLIPGSNKLIPTDLPVPAAPGAQPSKGPDGLPTTCTAAGGSEAAGSAPTENNRGPGCPGTSVADQYENDEVEYDTYGPSEAKGKDVKGGDAKSKDEATSATGLQEKQEGAMVEQLLGGGN